MDYQNLVCFYKCCSRDLHLYRTLFVEKRSKSEAHQTSMIELLAKIVYSLHYRCLTESLIRLLNSGLSFKSLSFHNNLRTSCPLA